MPVNMDPSKKRRRGQAAPPPPAQQAREETAPPQRLPFGEETPSDREKDMADAEWKNLWDATEVIDMDKI